MQTNSKLEVTTCGVRFVKYHKIQYYFSCHKTHPRNNFIKIMGNIERVLAAERNESLALQSKRTISDAMLSYF